MAKKQDKKPSLVDEKSNFVPLIPREDQNNNPYFTFSFRYFDQQRFFGFKEGSAEWFATVLERLKDLSGKTRTLLEDKKEKFNYRLHPINWDQPNCPITIDDIQSLPKNIKDALKSKQEFYVWQFQLSKGKGRVIGFFNNDSTIFYVLLLDKDHNLQPSKDFDYNVNENEIAMTPYEEINSKIIEWSNLQHKCEQKEKCPISFQSMLDPELTYLGVDKELVIPYIELLKEGTFKQLFEEFLLTKLN